MGFVVDETWARTVCACCDPVFAAADVGFVPQQQNYVGTTALLWEADPQRFADRYPDSRIEASYGSGWSGVTCIDYWLYIDEETQTGRLSIEGKMGEHPNELELTGDGALDGLTIANAFAAILRVTPPSV